MNTAVVEALIAQARLLPADERELLLLRLQLELAPGPTAPEVEAAWITEAERRLDAVDQGAMATVPWEDVRKDLGLS